MVAVPADLAGEGDLLTITEAPRDPRLVEPHAFQTMRAAVAENDADDLLAAAGLCREPAGPIVENERGQRICRRGNLKLCGFEIAAYVPGRTVPHGDRACCGARETGIGRRSKRQRSAVFKRSKHRIRARRPFQEIKLPA